MPELFNEESNIPQKDRLLCDIYDDLAFINGCPYNELPAYWSILKEKNDWGYDITHTCSESITLQLKENPDGIIGLYRPDIVR